MGSQFIHSLTNLHRITRICAVGEGEKLGNTTDHWQDKLKEINLPNLIPLPLP
jgi:hypothetical protein